MKLVVKKVLNVAVDLGKFHNKLTALYFRFSMACNSKKISELFFAHSRFVIFSFNMTGKNPNHQNKRV